MPADPADVFVTVYPGTCTVEYHPIDLDRDMPVVHGWLHQDYARHWGMQDQSLAQARAAYERLARQPDQDIRIGRLGGTLQPLCLLECYHPLLDVLAGHCDVKASDRGLHLLVAPPAQRPRTVPSLSWYLLHAAASHLFRDPTVQRVLVEPDIRNEAMHILCRRAGYEAVGVLHLPDKTALLLQLTRDRHASLPADPAPRAAPPLTPLQVQRHLMLGRVKRRLHTIF
jgi:hypothetical protein